MGMLKTICARWVYALSDSCFFRGWICERSQNTEVLRTDRKTPAFSAPG
jgi:hypothetical protein